MINPDNFGATISGGRLNVSVWSPSRKSMRLQIAGMEKKEMNREGEFFRIKIPVPPEPIRYLLEIDGAVYPDPCSRYQPEGVKNASQAMSSESYAWRNNSWEQIGIDDMVLYEAHIGTFTSQGTFLSAIQKLDYLEDLGINALEIMPVNQTYGSRNWGYDGVFPFAPNYSYGTPDSLKRLVDECHSRSIACILDVIYNHLGPIGNVFPKFGPYFTDRYKTPWGKALNLDGKYSSGVRDTLVSNAIYWLDQFRFDGLRLDSTQNLYDSSDEHFLSYLSRNVQEYAKSKSREITIIGESDRNDIRLLRDRKSGGYGLDALWADDFHHSVHSFLSGENAGYYMDFGSLEDIYLTVKNGFLYNGRLSAFSGEIRGTDFLSLDPGARRQNVSRLVFCIQNHDQVGNRAKCDRLISIIPPDRARLAASLLLLSPYTPMLFMGEEYGEDAPFWFFVDTDDAKFAEKVGAGRRAEFKHFNWKDTFMEPNSPAAFANSKLSWEISGRRKMFLAMYRELISLRKRYLGLESRIGFNASLHGSVFTVEYPQPENERLLAEFNMGSDTALIEGRRLFTTADSRFGGPGSGESELPGFSASLSLAR